MHLQIERHHEEHGVKEACVDVTADVLIVESDVNPSTGAGQIGTHLIMSLKLI